VPLHRLFDRSLHVDIDQDVDTAAQIETEVHRPATDRTEPTGHIRRKRQGMGELGRRCLGHHLLCGQLVFRCIEADLKTIGLQLGRLDRDLRTFECRQDILMQCLADLLAARARHLDDRIL